MKSKEKNDEVYCKYTHLPLKRVFGVIYGDTKVRKLIGPFLSPGVGIRYYWEKMKRGELSQAKYNQYLTNFAGQLCIDSAVLLANPEEFMPPAVDYLSSHDGSLSRQQYMDEDPTLTKFAEQSNRVGLTPQQYQTLKREEQSKKMPPKLPNKSEELLLYVIDARPDLEKAKRILRISPDNEYFTSFLSSKHQARVQVLPNGSTRIVWWAGQRINSLAMSCLYGRLPKELKRDKKYLLKGRVFVACTKSSDLKLKGCLPLTDYSQMIQLDLGDQKPETDEPKPTGPPEIGSNEPNPKTEQPLDQDPDTLHDEILAEFLGEEPQTVPQPTATPKKDAKTKTPPPRKKLPRPAKKAKTNPTPV